MTVIVCTYATDTNKATPLLVSAELHGVPVRNLCTTTKWTGLKDKLCAMRTFLEPLPQDDIVCFVDAYDVIVNQPLAVLEKTFLASGAKILFGAERQLDPPHEDLAVYPHSATEFKFLNSGVYIGFVSSLRDLLNGSIESYANDQLYCHIAFKNHHKTANIKLDTTASLVVNMFGVEWRRLAIEHGQITLDESTTPCFFHFNGMSFLSVTRDFEQRNGDLAWNSLDVSLERLRWFVDAKKLTQSGPFLVYCTESGHTSM
jgi:hypothetical protein